MSLAHLVRVSGHPVGAPADGDVVPDLAPGALAAGLGQPAGVHAAEVVAGLVQAALGVTQALA